MSFFDVGINTWSSPIGVNKVKRLYNEHQHVIFSFISLSKEIKRREWE
jgi:hypothetical protein